MNILHVASEVYPLLKTGGLADVAYALPRAQRALGHDARVLVPGAPKILKGLADARVLAELGCLFGAARVRILLGTLPGSGIPAYVIDAPSLFRREGNPYLDASGREWQDNYRRYALLGWVGAHMAAGEIDFDFRPDVVHAHDWHAGLTPAYMADMPGLAARSVFTIHNLAFRGLFDYALVPDLGFSVGGGIARRCEFWGQISYLKAGVVFADKVTTVSPTYAREVLTDGMGFGMNGVLSSRGGDFEGVLNGLDYGVWDPSGDKGIAARYDAAHLKGKAKCKKSLLEEFGLEDNGAPVFGIVSRLADQKGLDLVLEAVPHIIDLGAKLIVLGSGDKGLEAGFQAARDAHPDQVAVYIGYNEQLSHRLVAGCDCLMVPSRFEPCGLTQIMALRYGTLPLVRATGGLADTIAPVQGDSGDGFVFRDADASALCWALDEACALWADQNAWKAAQRRAMAKNFSWEQAAQRYLALYGA